MMEDIREKIRNYVVSNNGEYVAPDGMCLPNGVAEAEFTNHEDACKFVLKLSNWGISHKYDPDDDYYKYPMSSITVKKIYFLEKDLYEHLQI